VVATETALTDDQPRRSLADDPEVEVAVDQVVPRHSADPENEDPVAEDEDPDLTDADMVGTEEPDAAEDFLETAPVDAAAPEDVPRRARSETDARLLDETDLPDDYPVFQKSATPFWTGITTHPED
jgi:hypothetical protein